MSTAGVDVVEWIELVAGLCRENCGMMPQSCRTMTAAESLHVATPNRTPHASNACPIAVQAEGTKQLGRNSQVESSTPTPACHAARDAAAAARHVHLALPLLAAVRRF